MVRTKVLSLLLSGVMLGSLGACATVENMTSSLRPYDCGPVEAALAHSDRPQTDRDRDAGRKPDEVLCFLGVTSRMDVLDLFAAGGYYTEILGHLTQGEGSVTAYNNAGYYNFSKDAIAKRYDGSRLTEVKHVTAEVDAMPFEAGEFDVAILILAYHDIYFKEEGEDEGIIDGPAMLAGVMKSLKPGGVLGVVDHVAKEGAPVETGGTIHRIDPALMRREIEAAGFVFDGEHDALRNPEDDLEKPMWAKGIRGKTDRVIYRFEKPKR